jgi:hypothetical protein
LVPDPPPPPPEPGTEPPGRARGRIDVPTQEHPPPGDTGDLPPLPGDEAELGRPDTTYEPPPLEEPPSDEEPLPSDDTSSVSDGPDLYDFETDEDRSRRRQSNRRSTVTSRRSVQPRRRPRTSRGEPYAEEPGTEVRPPVGDEDTGERRTSGTEEHFEEEEAGEEDLWFEKGPPKDFDFDD